MFLEEHIKELSEYNLSLETYNGNFIVSLKYKNGWTVKKPENDNIVFSFDNDNGVCYYAVPITSDIECVFNAINETIQRNKEMEEKVALYKEKREEMKELFRTKPLSELKKMEFTFPTPKKDKSKKQKEQQKEETKQTSEPNKNEVKETNKPFVVLDKKPIDVVENKGVDIFQDEEKEEKKTVNPEVLKEAERIDELVSKAISQKQKRKKK